MSPTQRYAKQQTKARQRRRLKARERLERDRRQAQRAAEALQQALDALGLPKDLVTEIEGRIRSQHKLLSKIVGVMFPPLFGCRTNAELCRVRGWDKNLPSHVLGALPKRSWLKRLRRLGVDGLVPLWRYAASASAATRSRWQWTWVADDSVFKKYGEQLGLVGTWWSGQEHRVLSGIAGVLLVVVIGEGKLVVPVDFAIRRPDPIGPGAPCRDKLHWVQVMLDGRVAAFRKRGVELPPPMVVADSWLVVFQKWRSTEIAVTLGLIFVASLRKEWPMTFIAVRCPHCQSDQIVKRGKTARGTQRYLCQNTLCSKGSFLLDYYNRGCLPEVKQTIIDTIATTEIHANHLEAFHTSLRRRCAAYRRHTNMYAKKTGRLQERLDVYWIVHNFVRVHFTTRQVPAVALGVLEERLSLQEIFLIQKAA